MPSGRQDIVYRKKCMATIQNERQRREEIKVAKIRGRLMHIYIYSTTLIQRHESCAE